jgi:signal transduction histidine kinase
MLGRFNSTKLYVALVSTVGVGVLVAMAFRVELEPLRRAPVTVTMFAAFVLVGELITVPIRRRGATKLITATNTFAAALLVVAGTALAVLVLAAASAIADLIQRKAPIKVAFNLAQWAIALALGGLTYTALGGGRTVTAASLPALAAGGVVFLLVNGALVSIVVSLADGASVLRGLVEDLRVEVGSSAMLLALAPVAVVSAERTPLLVPALLLPVIAVHLASRGEIQAEQRRREAQALAEREQELVRRLQEADRLKDDLIDRVSHELRSPLTTIIGVLGLLGRRDRRFTEDQRTEDQRTELRLMGLRQGQRLQRMIEQLLQAARFRDHDLSVTSLPQRRDELDAAEVLLQAAAEAKARHPDREIMVDTDGALPVRAAPDAVAQVLGNLVDNACKYSPEGEPVRLSGRRDGAMAVLGIEDSGPGIAPADRERVFERFTQLTGSEHQRAGGIGLGLYIARELARSQDGELLVGEAVRATGARFELRLPLRKQATGS